MSNEFDKIDEMLSKALDQVEDKKENLEEKSEATEILEAKEESINNVVSDTTDVKVDDSHEKPQEVEKEHPDEEIRPKKKAYKGVSKQKLLDEVIYAKTKEELMTESKKASGGLKAVGIIALILSLLGVALIGLCVYFMMLFPNYDKDVTGDIVYGEYEAITEEENLNPKDALPVILTETTENTEDEEEDTSSDTESSEEE